MAGMAGSLSERWAADGGLFRQAFTTRGERQQKRSGRIAAALFAFRVR
jgi:anti-sigma factor RsiW